MPSLIDMVSGIGNIYREGMLGVGGYGYIREGGGVVVDSPHHRVYSWGKGAISYDSRVGMTSSLKILDPGQVKLASGAAYNPGGLATFASGAGLVFSGINLAAGFYEGGFSGLANAASVDVGIMVGHSAVARPRIEKITEGINKGKYSLGPPGMVRNIGAGVGALAGASIGNAYLGPIGSIIGGVGGAAMTGTVPGAMASAAIAGGALVSYGAYSYLKSGYRHGRDIRMSRVPHTAGDTSSFFTQNAFTMRSQAIQAMRNSHLNARTALGQEATFMHTNKNYFSRYR